MEILPSHSAYYSKFVIILFNKNLLIWDFEGEFQKKTLQNQFKAY